MEPMTRVIVAGVAMATLGGGVAPAAAEIHGWFIGSDGASAPLTKQKKPLEVPASSRSSVVVSSTSTNTFIGLHSGATVWDTIPISRPVTEVAVGAVTEPVIHRAETEGAARPVAVLVVGDEVLLIAFPGSRLRV